MDSQTTIGDGIVAADKYMRRLLAVFLAIFLGLVIAVMIIAGDGLDIRNYVAHVLGFALLGILIWRYAQRDNYRAEKAGNNALVVTSLAEDIGLTAFVIFVGGIGLGIFTDLPAAVVHAGGSAGAVAYYVGRRFWNNSFFDENDSTDVL